MNHYTVEKAVGADTDIVALLFMHDQVVNSSKHGGSYRLATPAAEEKLLELVVHKLIISVSVLCSSSPDVFERCLQQQAAGIMSVTECPKPPPTCCVS